MQSKRERYGRRDWMCGKESRAQRNQIYSEYNDWTFGYITAQKFIFRRAAHRMQNDISIRLSRTNGLQIITNVSSVHMVQCVFFPLFLSLNHSLSLSLPLRLPSTPRKTDCIHQAKHQPFYVMNRILLLKMKTIMPDALWPSQNSIPKWMNERTTFQMNFLFVIGWCLPWVYLWLGRLLSNISTTKKLVSDFDVLVIQFTAADCVVFHALQTIPTWTFHVFFFSSLFCL